LSNLGGAAAIAKVRKEWQDDDTIQVWVRCLAKLIGTDMNSWTGIMLIDTPESHRSEHRIYCHRT
jgi:hypothetical protein